MPEQQQQVQQNKQEEEEEDFEIEEDPDIEILKDADDDDDDIGQGLYPESSVVEQELEEGWEYDESDEQEFRPFMPN